MPEVTQVKLRDVASRVAIRNTVGSTNVLTISASHGLVSQEDFFNRRVAGADLSQYYLLRAGDFAYNKSYSAGWPVGVARRLERYEEGVVSPLYICFRPDPARVDPSYLQYYFDSGLLNEAILWIAKEGVRNHGLLNVGVEDFFDLSLDLPNLAEQQRIVEVLDCLSEAERLIRASIAKLNVVKAGVIGNELDRLYSGRDRVALGDIAVVERGRFSARPRNDPSYFGGLYPFIQTGDVVSARGGLIREASQWLNDAGLAVSRLFPAGTVAVTIAANIGDTAILGADMCFPDSVVGVVARSTFVPRFVELCLRRAKPQLEAQAPQSAQRNINLQVLRPLEIPEVPYEVQASLVKIWSAYGGEVEVMEGELAKLRRLKRGLVGDLLSSRPSVLASSA
ncbi:restriction endonuclease subunit S [Streptomyces goshikiensis]|uniref:restriction endonuclease subunit S n=1 Tax=Streptomyces goshikiensis TaxID=1942 RepID=UPI003679BCCE